MNWYIKVLNQYGDFEGRARRTEYWMFALFQLLIGIVLTILSGAAPLLGAILFLIFALGTLIPSLAVTVRRLHDSGSSGLLILLNLIPYLGAIVIAILCCKDSMPGSNEYGDNPKDNDYENQKPRSKNEIAPKINFDKDEQKEEKATYVYSDDISEKKEVSQSAVDHSLNNKLEIKGNEGIDELMNMVSAETDQNSRLAIYNSIKKILSVENPILFQIFDRKVKDLL
tara:strand:- start:207 stop:887 length:681 start_codon:yes stop_codon:yes gene_type:complete